MPQDSAPQNNLVAAQAHIQQLSQQLVAEREAARQAQAQLQTQLEQQQQRINQLEAREAAYWYLFDHNPQPMWVYDLETLRFLAVNAAAVAKYGYSAAEFLAMTIVAIRPPEEVPRLLKNIAQVDEGLDLAGIWQHCLRDGRVIQVKITSYALDFAGRRAELVMAEDVTAQIEAEQALRRSEERYRFLVEFAPQLTWSADSLGRNLYASPRMGAYVGIPTEQLLNFDWELAVHPDDLARVHDRWMESVQTGKPYETEYRMRRADGEYRWHLIQAIRVQQGPEMEWLGLATEIHDRKRAELALADWNQSLEQLNQSLEQTILDRTTALSASEARLQGLLDASLATTYSCRPDGDYACTYISNNVEALLGYTAAEFCARADFWERQLHPADAPQVRARVARLGQDGILKHEYRLRHREGHYIWVRDELTLLRDAAGQPTEVVGYVVDIRDRKQAEQDLQTSEQRLRLALEAANAMVWERDLATNTVLWGGDSDLRTPTSMTHDQGMALIHPDDRPAWEAAYARAIATGTGFQLEHRIALPANPDQYRWFQTHAQVTTDVHGTPTQIVGLSLDITTRIQQETHLKRQLATIEAAIDGIAITLDNTFLYVNRAHLDLFGYTQAEELLGQSWSILYAPAEIVRFEQEVVPLLVREQHWSGEAVAVRKDGTTFEQRLSLTVTDDGFVICITEDISDRKQAELERQQLMDRLTLALQAGAIGIWDWDMVHDALWDDRMYAIYGLQDLGRPITYQDWRDRVDPKDLNRVEAQLQAATTTQAPFNAEFRIRRPDGELRWVQAVAKTYCDHQGNPIRMVGINHDITDRKRTEVELQKSEEELRLFIATSSDIVYRMSADWQEVQPLDGKNFIASADQPSQSWMASYIPPEEQPKVWATIKASLAAKCPYELEHRVIRKDGSLGWVFSRAIPVLDAQGDIVEWFGTASDISDRKQVERELQASQAYFQGIVTDQTELICRFLPDGTLTFVNQAYCQFFHKSPADLIGHRFTPLLPEEDQDIPRAHFRRLSVDHPVITYEHRVIAPDGSIHWQQWTDRAFFAPDGTPLEYQAVGHDITPLKAAEAQLRHSNQELQRATRLKDEFLANMSHELRTPLNAILGMTEGLQEEIFGIVNEKQLHALRTIEKSANHLLSLINDILDVAKIESGHINLDYSPVPIAHLCSSSLDFVKPQALKKRIQLTSQIPAPLPTLVIDEIRMRQVLLNLLTNAVKFTPAGGTVTLTAVLIPPDPETSQPGTLRLSITDNGIGIAAENIPKLFQPFVQIDSALNRQQMGTGLGLALVKQIVELHGGQIGLTSELGVGSCFTVDLPYAADGISVLPSVAAPTPPRPRPAPPTDRALTPLPAPVILLAEDNFDNVAMLSGYLEAKGYRLIYAQDGQQALDQALSHHPDLILMDVQMPGMDGLEATQRIRQQDSLRETPIIVLTALAMQGDRERCLAAGADDYLSKPVRLRQLDTVIQELLAHR